MMGLETNLSRDFKPHYALTSCWYQVSRVTGKLVEQKDRYVLQCIHILTIMTPMHDIK